PEAVSTNLAIAGGAVGVARAVHAKAIVALTESGSTAFEISRHNITLPIFALTPSISAQRRMAMYRGVRPMILATSTDHDTALNEVEAVLVEHQILCSGDQYIITSGSKMRESGSTNTLEVLQVK
ncbi:pyruvate kinase, partial [Myxococcus sp. AM001]|nr:pyruvate kinase [Myxococcus sp. AM001]